MENNNIAAGTQVDLTKLLPIGMTKLIDSLISRSRDELERGQTEIPPFAFIGDSLTHKGFIAVLDFANEERKRASAADIRSFAKKLGADFVLLVSESWALQDDAAHDYMTNRHKYRSVSEHPGAKECLLLSLDTHGGNFMGRAEITKKGNGRTCGEPAFIRSESSEGILTNLLPMPVGQTVH